MYKVGSKVKMTNVAVENYGNEYKDVVFTIESVATMYMPASEFYRQGMPSGYHPGYDNGVGEPLYDLVDFNSSLYEYELQQIK